MNWIVETICGVPTSSSSGVGSHAAATRSSRRRSPREKIATGDGTTTDNQKGTIRTSATSTAMKDKGRIKHLGEDEDVKEEPTWRCQNCSRQNCPDDLRCPKCKARKLRSRSNTGSSVKEEEESCGVVKEEESYNPEECFICYDGGLLVCCDHCDKSFHMHCHIPPLQSVPTEKWMCCECKASSYSRLSRCGQCEACLREDCGKCMYCLDMSKFGGSHVLKQVCTHRVCPYKRYAQPAKVSPEQVVPLLNIEEEGRGEGVVSALFSPEEKPAVQHNTGKRKHCSLVLERLSHSANNKSVGTAASRRSKKSRKASPKAEGTIKNNGAKDDIGVSEPFSASTSAAAAVATRNPSANHSTTKNTLCSIENNSATNGSSAGGIGLASGPTATVAARQPALNNGGHKKRESDNKPADSIEMFSLGGGLDDDVYSQATTPFLDAGDNDIPNNPALCQMELRRAQAEIKRLADENRRLKLAVRALTASLTG